jgi:hypothetical protein
MLDLDGIDPDVSEPAPFDFQVLDKVLLRRIGRGLLAHLARGEPNDSRMTGCRERVDLCGSRSFRTVCHGSNHSNGSKRRPSNDQARPAPMAPRTEWNAGKRKEDAGSGSAGRARRGYKRQVVLVKVLRGDVSPAAVRDKDKDAFLDQIVKAAVPYVGDPAGGFNIVERRQVVSSNEVFVRYFFHCAVSVAVRRYMRLPTAMAALGKCEWKPL